MTSINKKLKKLVSSDKKSLFTIFAFLVFILVVSVRVAYAFYNKTSTPVQIVRSVIGNFNDVSDDIVIEVYTETGYETDVYVLGYNVPSHITHDLDVVDCDIPACETTDSLASCHYRYNAPSREITITSDRKVKCKFYFNLVATPDIVVYIMREDINSSTNPKTYDLVDDIPAYGYVYSSSSCTNNVEATYDSRLRKFNFTTNSKTVCYAYFDAIGINNADIIANIYVQSEVNSDTYVEVETIPSNIEYEISTDPNFVSSCMTMDSPSVPSTPPTMDEDGYLIINSPDRVTCTVYLDIVDND